MAPPGSAEGTVEEARGAQVKRRSSPVVSVANLVSGAASETVPASTMVSVEVSVVDSASALEQGQVPEQVPKLAAESMSVPAWRRRTQRPTRCSTRPRYQPPE